jgi:DNA polymerase III delta prime subunit
VSNPAVDLTMLAVAGLAPSVSILGLRSRDAARWSSDLEAYRLSLTDDLSMAHVEQFLAGLSGIRASGWRRLVEARAIGLEITSSASGIAHHLLIAPAQRDIVLTHLRAALSGVSAAPDEDYGTPTPTLAGELTSTSRDQQLAVGNAPGTSTAILASLQPLDVGETMVVQLVITPHGSRSAESVTPRWIWNDQSAKTPIPRSMRDKYSRPLFSVTIRIGVASRSKARDRRLLGRLTGAFHAANSPEANLRRRRTPTNLVARDLSGRRLGTTGSRSHLNSAELAGLLALPMAGVNLPGLRLSGCRPLAPDTSIAQTGRVVADSSFPGMHRPLALSAKDSLRHLHLIGPTGVGKSTLILNLVTQDMEAGRGVVVIDPKADLVADVISRVPAHRADDVIVVDPTDDERPVGVNLLAGGVEAPELVAEQVLGTFHRLYAASWGPRTDDILRAGLLTLVGVPGMTLAEVPLLLTDAAFRRDLVGRLDDPIGLEPFWAGFEAQSEAERAQATGPVLNKLRSVLMRPRLRNVLGQSAPLLDFDDVLANGRILLVPLSKGLLGEDAAALLGSMLIARLWQAVQRRAGLVQSDRHPVFCYIDEFQDYIALPTPIPDLLAQARALGLGLTLAHQNLDQLSREVREAVLANARSRVIFQPSASDARRLARELEPHLAARDLQALGAFEAVVTLSTGSRVAPPATGITRGAPPTTSDGDAIRAGSRLRYGRDRADIETEMRRRHERPAGSGPLGRQRRTP